jgi:hypothetical protein
MALAQAACAATVLFAGCAEEGPATPDELKAIAALQSVQGQFEMDEKGHARVLFFAGSTVRDADLVPVEQLHGLRLLNLQRTMITDAGLVHVSKLPELKALSLKGTNVTDAGLEHLKGLPLEELDLERTKVTDVGMPSLATITTLKKVYLGPGGATGAGKSYLEAAIPRIQVFMK